MSQSNWSMRVDMYALRRQLVGNPSNWGDFTMDAEIVVPMLLSPGCKLRVVVLPPNKRPHVFHWQKGYVRARCMKHRAFARIGERLIPLGRLHQAKL